jgi:hypothetical protein
VIQPPTWMRGQGKGRGACGVIRRENGDGRGKRGRRCRAAPFFKWRGDGVGERLGGWWWHGTTHGGGDGGPGLTGGRCPDRQRPAQPRRARAVRRCPNMGAPGASKAWAPADSGRERERERRAVGRVGQPREKGKWAEPEGT